MERKHIAITGNPIEGFHFIGPFPNKRQAELWIEEAEGDWWTAPIGEPVES